MAGYEWTDDACRAYVQGMRPLVRVDHAPWARKILRRLKTMPAGSTVLDVGTGPGFLLREVARRLPEMRLIALDQSQSMLSTAQSELERAQLKAETLCCPVEHIALPDGCVDVVLCKHLLHLADDVDGALGEILRVLKPGGQAFIIDFDAQGSVFQARTVWLTMALMQGKTFADDFWKSFSARLPGTLVREQLLKAGFSEAEYVPSGFNYLLVGSKAPPS